MHEIYPLLFNYTSLALLHCISGHHPLSEIDKSDLD